MLEFTPTVVVGSVGRECRASFIGVGRLTGRLHRRHIRHKGARLIMDSQHGAPIPEVFDPRPWGLIAGGYWLSSLGSAQQSPSNNAATDDVCKASITATGQMNARLFTSAHFLRNYFQMAASLSSQALPRLSQLPLYRHPQINMTPSGLDFLRMRWM